MVFLEADKTMEELSLSSEMKDGTVLSVPMESSSCSGTKEGMKVNYKGKS